MHRSIQRPFTSVIFVDPNKANKRTSKGNMAWSVARWHGSSTSFYNIHTINNLFTTLVIIIIIIWLPIALLWPSIHQGCIVIWPSIMATMDDLNNRRAGYGLESTEKVGSYVSSNSPITRCIWRASFKSAITCTSLATGPAPTFLRKLNMVCTYWLPLTNSRSVWQLASSFEPKSHGNITQTMLLVCNTHPRQDREAAHFVRFTRKNFKRAGLM